MGFWTLEFPVIIDNMMNLDLLFNATRLTGDSTYYKVAVKHAQTTMKHHFVRIIHLIMSSATIMTVQ